MQGMWIAKRLALTETHGPTAGRLRSWRIVSAGTCRRHPAALSCSLPLHHNSQNYLIDVHANNWQSSLRRQLSTGVDNSSSGFMPSMGTQPVSCQMDEVLAICAAVCKQLINRICVLKQNEYRGLVEVTLENIADCVEDACEDFSGFDSDLAVRLLRFWLFVDLVTHRYTNVG